MSLSTFFGPLELSVLESLWRAKTDASVRDLADEFSGVAYTTLMTTLDRLYKKGVLVRRKSGRAFRYAPVLGRKELESRLAAEALDSILGSVSGRSGMRPLLTSFVDAVSRKDELLLDELEKIVRARRRAAGESEEER